LLIVKVNFTVSVSVVLFQLCEYPEKGSVLKLAGLVDFGATGNAAFPAVVLEKVSFTRPWAELPG
jgi:predicted aspartyl protease